MQNSRSIKQIVLVAIAWGAVLLLSMAPANSQGQPFYWDFINVNIDMQANRVVVF